MKLLTTLLLLLSFSTQACDVTLSWTPPTENTDGSPLTDLSRYVIAYGTNKDKPNRWKNVDAPATSKRLVFDSEAAVYYFVIRAYNAAGIPSDKSNQVEHLCEQLSKPVAPVLSK